MKLNLAQQKQNNAGIQWQKAQKANNSEENLNQWSALRMAKVFAYHCAQRWYTTQHKTVLIIFPLLLQTIVIAQTTSTGGERAEPTENDTQKANDRHYSDAVYWRDCVPVVAWKSDFPSLRS